MESSGDRIKSVIRSIPPGKVSSYGRIAAMAGLINGARTVARILHSSSRACGLAWWRIVKADGRIALGRGSGFEAQQAALLAEGVAVDEDGVVDLGEYGWNGEEAGLP